MANYQSTSIKEAMNNIASNHYLLPAIQRKFVWKTQQIEMLFDSILRGYPINSFMLWKISDNDIKQNFKFYQFLKYYVEKFREENTEASTELLAKVFYAVIDGQQRMTSLLIGLVGYYKEKKASKWWQDTEEKTPMDEKKLYLEITEKNPISIDNEKAYNFRFMTIEQKENDNKMNPNHFWFKVGDVLQFANPADVTKYLSANSLISNEFALGTLLSLYNRINSEQLINYYIVDDQNQDKVLDIFVRTNSGGTPLTFSDLLMSIASANWTRYDARREIDETKKSIFSYGKPNFNVSQDFILKSILVLSDMDVRFRIDNFGKDSILFFESHWEDIKSSLIATFHLLEELNINDTMLRAKNAAIPVAYYIYKKGIADDIVKSTYNSDDKKKISKWLCMSLLKGIFGGTSDSVLKNIRDVINNTLSVNPLSEFPVQEIIDSFRSDPDKNYSFNDEIINSVLESQYGTAESEMVLNLLYPDVVIQHGSSTAQDHMHPKALFTDQTKLINIGISANDLVFYQDKTNYNSCLNLQLLETIQNNSKSDTDLETWANSYSKTNSDLMIEDNISLNIQCFKEFIESRRKTMKGKLENIFK